MHVMNFLHTSRFNPLANLRGKTGALAIALLLAASQVLALDLQDAKSQGLVGETVNGYLGAVKSSAEVNALVNDINAKRKAEYQRIAKQNGIAVSDVEALAGKKAIDKTPSGQYVNVTGSWMKK